MIKEANSCLKENRIRFVPQLGNLSFYNEPDIFLPEELEERSKKISTMLETENQYELFLQQKRRRPVYDIYACFHPFNEATKALYPFLKKLQQHVKKDDVILNLWDRTGWLTSLLAGLFPSQLIVTTWEGNKDVLGYKGFHFWMKESKNVNILFCDLNEPLPLKDKSVAFSVGIDTFHRFNQSLLLEELTRVVKDDGAIIFPHVHLTNSEPEPYFDRGCKQIHGKDYENVFNYLSQVTDWNGYVFSEPQLFIENDMLNSSNIPVISTPDTIDYNALLAILPKSWADEPLTSFSMKDMKSIGEARILVNLLLNIDLNQQIVYVDHTHLGGSVGHLLERHPIYIQRIRNLDNYRLSELVVKVIYLAKLGYTVDEVCTKLGLKQSDLLIELEVLEKLGLLQVLPISYDGIRLQYYLMSQEYITPKSKQNLKALWRHSVENFSKRIALISLQDQSEFTYEDCDEIIKNIVTSLFNSGLKKGDKVLICSNINTEAILLYWACMQTGLVVVPIGTHLVKEAVSYILQLSQAKLFFTHQLCYDENRTLTDSIPIIIFDEEEQSSSGIYFSDWLGDVNIALDDISEVTVNDDDEAVILFTSGSTGVPKGVQLSHGNLHRSGQSIADTFNWGEEDRFFAMGGLDTMSGLRNAAVAALHVGASVVIPRQNAIGNLFSIAEEINESQASVMGSNPSLLRQLVKHAGKIEGQLGSVKTLMCTGNNLTDTLRADFKAAYNLPILNYYGLTETTGICISESSFDQVVEGITIGKSVDCIAQIVDEHGKVVPPGEVGELRIFSENLMQGYFKQPELTSKAIKDHWFYTQDLARYTKNKTFQLIGRKQDIVKTSSEEIIYLTEIQQFITATGLVSDVAICAYMQEDIEKTAAFIVLNDALVLSPSLLKQQIRSLILEKLGAQKLPHQIHFLPKLPYSDNGKLLKNQLINELQ